MNPERGVQPLFSRLKLFSGLAVALPILALAMWLKGQPSRSPGPDRIVEGRAEIVAVGGGMKAWRLSAPDRRFGGLSALAVDRGQLLALTDSGVAVRFSPPRSGKAMRFALHDLPSGPGNPLRKSNRDSESLLADRDGRGWWVGFETRHSLWLFDRSLTRVLATRWLDVDWAANRGGEALAGGAKGEVMVLPEGGGPAVGGKLDAPEGTADATRLADGRLVLLVRRLGVSGFDNQLWIAAGAGKAARRIALDLGALDNMEGIAAAPRPDGGTRLWIVSDDNFRPWMRTLLVALDLPPGA